MPTDSATVLQQLAKVFKGKVSQCEVYDANVCTSRSVPSRPWELIPVSGEPFLQSLRLTCSGRRVTVLANNTHAHGAASGTFSSRPFAINAKQKVVFRSEFAEALSVGDQQYPIFTEDGRLSSDQKDLLGRPELVSLVAQASLKEGESFYFTKGEIGFYFRRPDASRISEVIDRVIDLAGKVEIAEKEPKLDLLPVQFHPLIPMIRKWAIADDSERNDLLAVTPEAVLRSLTEEVSPYFDAIESYLDSFRVEAPTEQADALGRLAECALDAKRHLSDKTAC